MKLLIGTSRTMHYMKPMEICVTGHMGGEMVLWKPELGTRILDIRRPYSSHPNWTQLNLTRQNGNNWVLGSEELSVNQATTTQFAQLPLAFWERQFA